MLSLRVVTILSLMFTFASLMPGKHFLIETDDATGDAAEEFDESAYTDVDILDDKEDDVDAVDSPPKKAASRNRQRLTYRDPTTRRTPAPAPPPPTPPAWSIRLL